MPQHSKPSDDELIGGFMIIVGLAGIAVLALAGAYCFFTGIPNHGGHVNNFAEACLGVAMWIVALFSLWWVIDQTV